MNPSSDGVTTPAGEDRLLDEVEAGIFLNHFGEWDFTSVAAEQQSAVWLARLCARVRQLEAELADLKPMLGVPTAEEFLGLPVVAQQEHVITVQPGDRYKGSLNIRGAASVAVVRIVRRQDFAWLEYVAFPETGTEICDHCGEEEPKSCREVRGRHICFSCYLNTPVETAP